MVRTIALFIISTSLLMAQIQVVQPAVAAIDDPMAIRYNPAGLGFNNHTETMLMAHFDGSAFTRDFAYFSQSKNTGFAYQWDVVSATNIWRFSQGIKLTKSQSIGFTYSFDNSRWKEGRFDLGWMHRPFPMLALGAQIQNVWSGDSDPLKLNTGFAVQNRTGRIGAGFDLGITEGNSDTDGFLTGFIEPIKGVRLNAFSELGNSNYGISLSIFMPDMGVESHGNSSSFSSQTLVLRSTENPYRSVFGEKALKKDTKTYLRMKLDGLFIEEPEIKKPKFPIKFDMDIPFIGSPAVYGKQLKNFVDEMQEYTEDPDVDGMIIDLGNVRAGFSKMTEMRDAFQRFHDAGKEIIVYSKFGLGNATTYLLSMADEIYVHEMAGVDLRGLAMEVTFFRGLLDTLSIVPEVWRVSPFKTAADTYLNDTMSEAMRVNYSQLLEGIYDEFIAGIAEGKDWDIEKTREIVDNGPYMLTTKARVAGLITGTMYPDEFDDYVDDLNDGKVKIVKVKVKTEIPEYQYAWRDDKVSDQIAVIYAVGGIVSGKSKRGPAGSTSMGDETIANAIKEAREDKSIKAIVLRIDSGGGSALASDIMWREILKTTETDSANIKPFIASMSDVAASGGYYIACQADSIIAYPSTITGSIGVIGMRLNFSQLMERFGVHSEGIKMGKNADFASGSRLATEEENALILESINDTYLKFKERVVKGREGLNDVDALDSLALGRVWTGLDAKKYGLIDEVGGYYDAIELAKKAAGIEGDVEIVELPRREKKTDFKNMFNQRAQIDLLSSNVLESLKVNDLIPIIEGGKIQMVMPVKVEIK
ncbi:MAG: signal peptide peptidase SppA [Candidatus Marinimicrobia bacterium]|nr:signal peptide peptidase SppA [Candidatus Neomarinimicrobiota bacterium]MCF7921581.1 signal peptide peptidase SppA [Candidatus Neomarinimicrobiota bacterium]